MRLHRALILAAALSLTACVADAGDPAVPEAEEVAADQSAVAGGGCLDSPRTFADRYYCEQYDARNGWAYLGDVYLDFLTNSFPESASGSFKQYNRAAPYKVTYAFTMTAVQALGGCLHEATGVSQWSWRNATTGQTCTLFANKHSYPERRTLAFDGCSNGVLTFCVEHNGPRAFGGAYD